MEEFDKLVYVSGKPVAFSFDTPDWATEKFINEINNIQGLKKNIIS